MNWITFSLYGDSPKYIIGAIRNAELQPAIYPGWKCAFWVSEEIPQSVTDNLRKLGALVLRPDNQIKAPMFWRFLGAELPMCQRFIVRDADSRLNAREAAAVRSWVYSGSSCHSMRDHPAHAREINGGMFGLLARAGRGMRQMILDFNPDTEYSTDQTFLCQRLWPIVCGDCLQHDSVSRDRFPGSRQFPVGRNGSPRFCGEVFDVLPDGEEVPRDGDWQQIDPGVD